MKRRCLSACFLALLAFAPRILYAQQEPQGVAAAWDVRTQMAALAASVRHVEPLLKHVSPADWVEKGAPDAYVRQLQTTQQAIAALVASCDELARQPEKMAVALDVYFQMERMELLMGSLREGIRKYQSTELDELIRQDLASNVVHRERLRQHIRDLADLREQEYQIANEEAQRCRGLLTKQPTAASQQQKSSSTTSKPASSATSTTTGTSAPATKTPSTRTPSRTSSPKSSPKR